MPDFHALLIGIDDYRRVGSLSLEPLLGCVHDVHSMQGFLERRFAGQLRLQTLVAQRRDGLGVGPKLRDDSRPRPTLEAIRQGFADLLAAAVAGDQALIYFSGHGIRLPTRSRDGDGYPFDECLVPADLTPPIEEAVLRDVEMASWLQRLAQREIALTLIIDCCHSGGASKDLESRFELAPFFGVPSSRAVVCTSAWLPQTPQGTVFLASCQPHQEAHQTWVGDRFRGFMTTCLVEILEELGTEATWETVHRRLVMAVHRVIGHQTPRLEGERARLCLGWGFGSTHSPEVELPGFEPQRTSWTLQPGLSAALGPAIESALASTDLLSRVVEGKADLSLGRFGEGQLALRDRSGKALLHWADVRRAGAIAAALEHLARYRYIRHLENPLSTIWRCLELVIERSHGASQGLEKWAEDTAPPGYVVSLGREERAELRLRNRGDRILYVTLFGLGEGWEIAQVYPEDSWNVSLEGRAVEGVQLENVPPEAVGSEREMLLLFVATDSLELRGLELAKWDSPTIGTSAKGQIESFASLRQILEEVDETAGKSAEECVWDWTVERLFIETVVER